VSGLEVKELPGHETDARFGNQAYSTVNPAAARRSQAYRPSHAPAMETPAGDAELVVSAPEFNEEFGTLPEHTEDPLTGMPLPAHSGHAPGASLPRWLEKHRPKGAKQPHQAVPMDRLAQSRARLVEERNFAVVEAVFDEIDQFERTVLTAAGEDALDDSDEDLQAVN